MLNVACFVQSCFAVADFVIFSNYCLIGTCPMPGAFVTAMLFRKGTMSKVKW